MFIAAAEEGNERNMDKKAVFAPDFKGYLPYGFDKGLGFNIAYCAAYFGYYHVRIRFLSHAVNKVLYFVCDMGDYLYGGAKIFAAPFLIQHVPVYFARGKV